MAPHRPAPFGNPQTSRSLHSFGSLACSWLSEDAPAFLVALEETTYARLGNGVSFVFQNVDNLAVSLPFVLKK